MPHLEMRVLQLVRVSDESWQVQYLCATSNLSLSSISFRKEMLSPLSEKQIYKDCLLCPIHKAK